jgi:hypothetical protein
MMSILYGEKDSKVRDQYIINAEVALEGLNEAGNVGKFLVDLLPFRMYLFQSSPLLPS